MMADIRKPARTALVVVPTFNERENLPVLVTALMAYPEVSMLVVDDASPDGTGALADELVMDPTTLTRTLRPLERRKLIRVATARDDRRRRNVALSDVGRAAFREAVPLWRKAGAQLGEVLGTRGHATLDQSLGSALAHLTTG